MVSPGKVARVKDQNKVAFILDAGLLNWAGGFNYLRNLITAIRSQKRPTVDPILFCGTNVDLKRFEPLAILAGEPICVHPAFNRTRSMSTAAASLLTGK